MSLRLPLAAVLTAALGLCLAASFAFPAHVSADENCRNCGPGGSGGGYGSSGYGAGCLPGDPNHADLFYNFYAKPACGGVPAEMYPAPYPTPPLVGHTYYTYQPLMPHEMLYRHHRTYRQYYNYGRGVNRTTVRWW